MDEAEIRAELDALRARVAALEFVVDIERADERRRVVEWAHAFEETPAGIAPSPQVLSWTEAALRRHVYLSSAANLVGEWPWTVAKGILFASWCNASEARAVVDHLRQRSVRWSDYAADAKGEEF